MMEVVKIANGDEGSIRVEGKRIGNG